MGMENITTKIRIGIIRGNGDMEFDMDKENLDTYRKE